CDHQPLRPGPCRSLRRPRGAGPAGCGQAGDALSRRVARRAQRDLLSRGVGNRGPTVVHVEQAVRAVTLVTQVGSVLPLLGSSTGLVFNAFLADAETAD